MWQTRRMAMLVIGLLCVAAPFQSANALDPGKALTQYVHSTWGVDEGLPQSYVTSILETSDGYLWVGTQAGIARFDGIRFTTFDHTNTPAFHDDYIADMVEDSHGTLWIATSNGGVTYFRDGVFSHLDSVGPREGLSLAADNAGNVWIGGYGSLAQVRNRKVIKTYRAVDGLSGDLVRRLVVDSDQSIWFSTTSGLSRLVAGRIQSYSIKGGLPGNDVIDLYLDSGKTLWIRTRDAELTRRVNGKFESWSASGLPNTGIRDTLKDRDGNMWFAGTGSGLLRIGTGTASHLTAEQGMSSDQVNTLYEDRAGNLWIGTGNGLDRLHDGAFKTYALEEGLSNERVNSVLEDSHGDVWIATDDGLNRLHGDQLKTYAAADGLPDANVFALREDHAKALWIGTASGIAKRDEDRFVPSQSMRDGIPDYQISGIFEDSKGQFWLSTRGGGLLRHHGSDISTYSKANGLLDDFVFAVAEGRQGEIWAGSSYGINSIQGTRIKGYRANKDLADAMVLSLYHDAGDVLWIGTGSRGLFRLENGRLSRYTTRQGLLDDTINNILADGAGNLWIGSNKGISRIALRDLSAVAAGSKTKLDALHFGRADGMKNSETTAGSQPAGWRARDGRLWFPTIQGVVVVDPLKISLSKHSPLARVEQLLADESPVSLASHVKLAPGIARIEIRYTAPNLSAPERTRFRYRLEGFDDNWIPGKAERVAQYTNLSPGHYTFHVSASADDGRWNDQEGTLDFYLSPRFYQTWWFRLLCVIPLMLLAWGFYRMRVNWLYAKTSVLEERQRIAGEIHDSLAQGLSGIVFQTEAALISMDRAPHMTSTHLASARDLAKTSLDDARYSVWNLSPPEMVPKNLVASLRAMAEQLAAGRVDKLEIRSSGTPWAMRSEAQHHVVLISQESLSNAIQHGNARTVSIEVTYTPDAVHLVISDDGTGFPQTINNPMPARGYGMNNIRRRADRLHARLEITSEVGKGARVSLRVPRASIVGRLWRRIRGKKSMRIE